MAADEEDKYVVAQANEPLDEEQQVCERSRVHTAVIQKDIREVRQ